jgi:hypothetical protein
MPVSPFTQVPVSRFIPGAMAKPPKERDRHG